MEAVYTTAELAERYGVKMATVQKWHETGKLDGFSLGGTRGGRLRFRESALVEFEGPAARGVVSPAPSVSPTRGLVSLPSPAPEGGVIDAS
jgi:hypothetical protein